MTKRLAKRKYFMPIEQFELLLESEYRFVPGTAEKYRIFKSGEVLYYKGGRPRLLARQINDGYPAYSIQGKTYKIHRLIAEAFIPKIEGKDVVNHKNGIKTDFRIENLEWCSHLENMFHAQVAGLLIRRDKSKRGRKERKIYQYTPYGVIVNIFKNATQAAEVIGCSLSSISSVCSGRQKTLKGFILSYSKNNLIQKSPKS